jgi:hypothetical protein
MEEAAPVAISLGSTVGSLLFGIVLFVVVIAVTAVLMAILQAVLPSTDSEASRVDAGAIAADDTATRPEAEAEDHQATSVR